MGPYSIYIVGKATINGKVVTEYVSARTVVAAALANLTYPPRPLLNQVGFAVTEKPPFSLTAKFDTPETINGTATTVTITATRDAGFAEEIAITAQGLPANVTAALKNIPKGMNEVKIQLTPAAAAAVGSFPVSFVGKAKFNNKDVTATSPSAALIVALPFELKVEPSPVKVPQGDKAKIKVTAVRKGGYMGPITLAVQAPPANVTAAAATIAMGQTVAEIELTAAATAALGDKADVKVLGTAPAPLNKQNASPNFTVSVVKK
jgi:hypothetical protein